MVYRRRLKIEDRRARGQGHADVEHRYRHRYVPSPGKSICRHKRHLVDAKVDSILGSNDVVRENGLSVLAWDRREGRAQSGLGFVGQDHAEVLKIDSIHFVEIEVLVTRSDEEFVLADGFSAICKYRAKTLGRADCTACENKARNWRSDWQLAQFDADFRVYRLKTSDGRGLKVHLVPMGWIQGPAIVASN